MLSQKGIAHLFLLLVVFVAIVTVGLLFVNKKKQQVALQTNNANQASVQLKSQYKNPFDKKDQFVNPFDQYKSPLYNLKQ